MSKEILVSVRSAEAEGSCNVCQAKEGDIFLIDLPRSSFRICPICAYDLRQKLVHNIDAWAMAQHRKWQEEEKKA